MNAPPSFLPARARRLRRPSGSTLLVTLGVILIILTFLSISVLLTSDFGRFAFRQQGDADVMAAADAGLEYAYAQWKATTSSSFLGLAGTAPVSSSFPSSATMAANMNSSTLPFAAEGISFTALSISLSDPNGIPNTSSSTPIGTTTSNVPGYPGWSGTTYNYVATVTVSNPTHYGFSSADTAHLTAHRYFQLTLVPLFQAAIFYENKLEIHPGADMTVSGLIHTNGNLWARGFSNLQFKSTVSYVGTYNEIGDSTISKGWDGYNYGWIPGIGSFASVPLVTWADGQTTGNSATRASQLTQVSPIDPFGGANTSNNGLYNLITVPAANNTSSQIAYNNASLIITVNSSLPTSNASRIVITDGSGNPLNAVDTAAVKAAINNGTTTTIYDMREAQNVVVTNLDMTKLAAATVASGTATPLQSSFNGTVYIQDVSPATATESAIRLINGRSLGQPVSVATNNGLYIQGDYNTGGTSASSVPSNVSNPNGTTSPQAPGYTRYASSVMADAVTILSNNWSDSNASASLSSRTATPTTVNTAILSGDVPSNSSTGQASGGAHNFPRFLENWNNVNFTYWGSLVEAFNSEEFTGPWQTGNVYYWPNREWNFDTNFLAKQPPGAASGIVFSRGRWQRN
jgi:hypothetical protein